MEANKSRTRNHFLVKLSREHHNALLLSWKIRTGFHRNIDPQRIKTYVDWYYHKYIIPHFAYEEKYMFSILDSDHEFIKKANAEHRRLQRLFEDDSDPERSLSLLEEELERHIRFEERILFPEIQKSATQQQLNAAREAYLEIPFVENTSDEFWKDNGNG